MLIVNLAEDKADRMRQAAEALMAAVYDPITFPASWATSFDQLAPMAQERLMAIVEAAVDATPGGRDDAAAIEWLKAVSTRRTGTTS